MVNIVEKIDCDVKVRHVLMSVSDKTGIVGFAGDLLRINHNLQIFSTGGTFKSLEEGLGKSAKGHLTEVAKYTCQPETQGGLVKTLDFKIYLGLLTETYNPSHQEDLKRTGAVPIDMVVVNLYPFSQTIEKPDCNAEIARANIDIGGPTMIRAAAKNFHRVAAVVEPADYSKVLNVMERCGGCTNLALRLRLMKTAFAHTAAYDDAIAEYFKDRSYEGVLKSYKHIVGLEGD